eukprot:6468336-Alexandrium_andersonii.AAC.1
MTSADSFAEVKAVGWQRTRQPPYAYPVCGTGGPKVAIGSCLPPLAGLCPHGDSVPTEACPVGTR